MTEKTFKALIAEAKRQDDYWTARVVHSFTEELYGLMEHRRVSKAELARRLGRSPAYVTKVLRGSTNFTIDSMVRLVRALDGRLYIHVGRREDKVRWFDVAGHREPPERPPRSGYAKVDTVTYPAEPDRTDGTVDEEIPAAA